MGRQVVSLGSRHLDFCTITHEVSNFRPRSIAAPRPPNGIAFEYYVEVSGESKASPLIAKPVPRHSVPPTQDPYLAAEEVGCGRLEPLQYSCYSAFFFVSCVTIAVRLAGCIALEICTQYNRQFLLDE